MLDVVQAWLNTQDQSFVVGLRKRILGEVPNVLVEWALTTNCLTDNWMQRMKVMEQLL